MGVELRGAKQLQMARDATMLPGDFPYIDHFE